MIGEYYFWKWADNDLPGKPCDVYAALLRGEMHSALQRFDSTPLLKLLSKVAAKRRRPCPGIEKFDGANWDLIKELLATGLSGFDENHGKTIDFLLPKLNGFELGQYPDEEYADITAEDLPVLLRRIRRGEPAATATLTDRRNSLCAMRRLWTAFDR